MSYIVPLSNLYLPICLIGIVYPNSKLIPYLPNHPSYPIVAIVIYFPNYLNYPNYPSHPNYPDYHFQKIPNSAVDGGVRCR